MPDRFSPLLTSLVATLLLSGCRPTASVGSAPIPLADRPPWQTVLQTPGFRISLDTAHLQAGPAHTWYAWFVTTHDQPQGPDTLRFDRGRIRLQVRCAPLAFKSVSEELALGDARPVFHHVWAQQGDSAVQWRSPSPDATDGRFLRAACVVLSGKHLPPD